MAAAANARREIYLREALIARRGKRYNADSGKIAKIFEIVIDSR